ncbi:MAG: hypothetical protein MAG715_01382 [Methanonatronarchaeales archaeon]|nr:hypothetical protein [Methanonatronarchaeales archaeon]
MELREVVSELGLETPEPPEPKGAYEPITVIGRSVHVSGQLPVRDGELLHEGKVGEDLTVEEARDAAELCALNVVALMHREEVLWDSVVTHLEGYVASSHDFYRHSEVINGASGLLEEILGEKGRHTRVAVGVSSLPLNSPVEVSLEARL